jgi:hypothetical protein
MRNHRVFEISKLAEPEVFFICNVFFKNQEPKVNYQNQIPAQDLYYGPEIAPNLSTVLKKVK